MKIPAPPFLTAIAGALLASLATTAQDDAAATPEPERSSFELGNFSVSLTVADLDASRAFYEKLGFEVFGGELSQGWLILQNATSTVGLFQGMFERNILTFNPGWDRNAEPLESFEDVRDLQRRLEAAGLKLATRADEDSTGPASLTLVDPDGNPILIDQHVPRPQAPPSEGD